MRICQGISSICRVDNAFVTIEEIMLYFSLDSLLLHAAPLLLLSRLCWNLAFRVVVIAAPVAL